ncbi:hypothetical protein O181_127071 [Austropuccinia psidii MF-1]|uniref:Uncharacterized protein n=1 Tax=Austropuccinia psidii MF-1 TaxID=1389203 RepID=A0A9Q3KVG9_9BASI|nr:hypothetical protein [Austropuccinia psidii MF-1]
MWTEAAKHSSLLLNLLPHEAIDMNSPQQLLKKAKMNIKKSISLNSLIPFGMKTTVQVKNSKLKLDPRGEILKALTYESEVQIHQDLDNLPTAVMEHENHEVPINTHEAVTHSQTKEAAIQIEGNQLVSNHKHYPYVPYYSQAPKDISNKIDTRNILKGGPQSTKQPDQYMLANVVPYSKLLQIHRGVLNGRKQ